MLRILGVFRTTYSASMTYLSTIDSLKMSGASNNFTPPTSPTGRRSGAQLLGVAVGPAVLWRGGRLHVPRRADLRGGGVLARRQGSLL